ncbi:MAG TPA: hypothetical protein PK160_02090, partial [Bacillota bacterium]|nr:hypothetical protein [Bacillota bacterium]
INLNKIYIIHYKKNYDAIIIGDKVFLYNRLSNNYELLQNKEKIADLKDKHLFWERWDKVEKYKFVDKRKKTILNFKIEDPAIVFKFHYSIKKSSSNIPSRIFENITKSFARNNIGTSLNTYYFYDINRKNNLVLPETIAKIIDSEY